MEARFIALWLKLAQWNVGGTLQATTKRPRQVKTNSTFQTLRILLTPYRIRSSAKSHPPSILHLMDTHLAPFGKAEIQLHLTGSIPKTSTSANNLPPP